MPAPAKLNLFLHVVGRRPDGYHLLQTAFRFIDRCDLLRLHRRDDGRVVRLNDVAGVPEEEDLCVRAARLLQSHGAGGQGVTIELEKRLPMGGGAGRRQFRCGDRPAGAQPALAARSFARTPAGDWPCIGG